MKTTQLDILDPILRKVSFTAKEARARGVHPSLLSHYVRSGQIERICRGVYRGLRTKRKEVPFEWEDLIATAESIPQGVVCLISALAIYELTDEIPRQFWIAVPHDSREPRRPLTKVVKVRDIKTGRTSIRLGQVNMKIFDRERTVIDSFRFLNKEIALKALKKYLEFRQQRPDIQKLFSYSKLFRAPIRKYVEAMML